MGLKRCTSLFAASLLLSVAPAFKAPVRLLSPSSLPVNELVGGERLAVVCVADWSDDTEKQRTQKRLVQSWAHVTKQRVACAVVLCSPAAEDEELFFHDRAHQQSSCAVLRSDNAACLQNARLGRWSVVREIMSYGVSVVSSDPDAVIASPQFLEYTYLLIDKHKHVDVLTMSDASTSTTTEVIPLLHTPVKGDMWSRSFPFVGRMGDAFAFKPENSWIDNEVRKILPLLRAGSHQLGLEDPTNCNHQYNTGFMLWRATNASNQLLSQWIDELAPMLALTNPDDQLSFYRLARTDARYCPLPTKKSTLTTETCGGDPQLQPAHGGVACLGLFNLPQFANGFVYQSQRAHEQYGVPAHVYHATYAQNKVTALKEEGFFHESDRLPGSTYLAYETHFPRLFVERNATWQYSYELVRYQLVQFVNALGIALLLNRTLVLPRMALSCQCFFYAPSPSTCTITGVRMRLPYVAPTDHWLQRYDGLGFEAPGFLDREKRVFNATLHHGSSLVDDAAIRKSLAHVDKIRNVRLVSTDLHVLQLQINDYKTRVMWEAIKSTVFGSWCCLDEGVHPNVQTFKARYELEGEPALTRANDASKMHGTCGM